jgi:hypothetical protein
MKTIFSRIAAAFGLFQVKQIISVVLVGMVLLTTSVDEANLSSGVKAKLDELTTQGETGRPRTTRQWQNENEALQGEPGKQLERIAKESTDAIGEMAEIYPQNAKTVTPGLNGGALPEDD